MKKKWNSVYIFCILSLLGILVTLIYVKYTPQEYVVRTSLIIADGRDGLKVGRRRKADPRYHLISIMESELIKRNVLADLASDQGLTLSKAEEYANLSENILITRAQDNTWVIACKNTNPVLAQKILELYIKNTVKIRELLEVEVEKDRLKIVDNGYEPVLWSTPKQRISTGIVFSILCALFITLALKRMTQRFFNNI
jgi:hypothetical protein